MAKYTLGSGVDQFKGSRGGSVFQRMGTSFAIRTRRKPLFRRTNRQSHSRSTFTGIQQYWRSLGSSEQTTWENQVGNFTRVNSLGETYTILPINLFAASNIPLVNANLPIVDEAQNPVTFPDIAYNIDEFELNPLGLSVDVSPDPVPSDFNLEIWASPILPEVLEYWTNIGLQPVVFDFQKYYRPMLSLSPGQSGVFQFQNEWIEAYGPQPNFDASLTPVVNISMAGILLSRLTGQRFLDEVDIQDFAV